VLDSRPPANAISHQTELLAMEIDADVSLGYTDRRRQFSLLLNDSRPSLSRRITPSVLRRFINATKSTQGKRKAADIWGEIRW
jgi:hypothetical protein